MIQRAPSVFLPPPRVTPQPEAIVRRVLERFGDRRFIERIELGKRPPITFQHTGYFRRSQPPVDALWAWVAAPAARRPGEPSSQRTSDYALASWEVTLVMGALRDEFCAAGGRPLVGWSFDGSVAGLSDAFEPFNQRFPNPTPAAIRWRVAALAERYDFRVVSLRLLRPLQLAPVLIVSTARDRDEFIDDVGEIMSTLDPERTTGGITGLSFEGMYFEARDADGAFVRVSNAGRGVGMGSQWSWNPCHYPFAHSEPIRSECP
jgi:hypothetical protein